MGYKIGTVSYGTTGLKTINLGTPSTPTNVTLIVQNKLGVNEGTLKHVSIGTSNGTTHRCTSYVKDGAGTAFDFDTSTKVISHYELSGGSPLEVLSATFDSFTSSGVKINVAVASNAYSIYIRADY